jgi:FkbM family methyltransferase
MRFEACPQAALNILSGAFRPFHIRGKVRLLERLVPMTGERRARVFDASIRLDLSDHIQRWIYFGEYEQEETKWVKEWLRPGMTVVDVGANVGYYTLLAASCVGPRGRVLAVEPSPYACARLRQAVVENTLAQVVTLQVALGSAAGEGTLYLPPLGNHAPSMVACDRKDCVTVALRTLDECLTEWHVDQVDLLKIDVEGFEPQVLAGARSALKAGRIRAILCELNDWWLRQTGGSAEELFSRITSEGFSDVLSPRQFRPGTCHTCFFVHRSASHGVGGREKQRGDALVGLA